MNHHRYFSRCLRAMGSPARVSQSQQRFCLLRDMKGKQTGVFFFLANLAIVFFGPPLTSDKAEKRHRSARPSVRQR